MFSSWLGRPYVKIWRKKGTRPTKKEEEVKKGFSALSREWARLSSEDRKAWEAFAARQKPRNIPHCLFVSYAILARDAGLPLPVRPPRSRVPARPVVKAVRENEGKALVVSWSFPKKSALPEGALLDLWIQITRPSRRAYDRHYHHALYVSAEEQVAVIEVAKPAWNCHIRARYILPDSTRSPFSEASA